MRKSHCRMRNSAQIALSHAQPPPTRRKNLNPIGKILFEISSNLSGTLPYTTGHSSVMYMQNLRPIGQVLAEIFKFSCKNKHTNKQTYKQTDKQTHRHACIRPTHQCICCLPSKVTISFRFLHFTLGSRLTIYSLLCLRFLIFVRILFTPLITFVPCTSFQLLISISNRFQAFTLVLL